MHEDDRRADDDCVMTFVSVVSAPSAFLNQAAGGGEEGEGTGE